MSRCPSQDWDDYSRIMEATIPPEEEEAIALANDILRQFILHKAPDMILRQIRQICLKQIDKCTNGLPNG